MLTMWRLLACSLIVLGWMGRAPASAQGSRGNEPVVYVFWGQSCPHSQRTMAYVRRLRLIEPTLLIKDYEIESNPINAAAHEQVLARIGITGVSVVPVTVIGENVLVGFESDEASGARIRGFIQQCRSTGCPDRIFDLVPRSEPDWTVTTLAPTRPSCAGSVRELRIEAPH